MQQADSGRLPFSQFSADSISSGQQLDSKRRNVALQRHNDRELSRGAAVDEECIPCADRMQICGGANDLRMRNAQWQYIQ